MGWRGRVAVLGERNFRRLFWARSISLLGDGMTPIAIAFAVLEIGGSASELGIVFAVESVAVLTFILAGGVLADRISPRVAMLRADLVRVGSMGLLAGLLIADAAAIWHLAVLYAISGAATAFFAPASSAVVPQVVGGERLQQANAVLNLSYSGGRAVGPALAGLLLALGSPGLAIAADALTFGVSALFLLRLRTPRPRSGDAPAFLAELRRGWSEFSSRRWIVAIVLAATISNAVFYPAFVVLGPTVAEASLGGASAWALIAAAFGAGALAGGFLSLLVRPRRPLLVAEAALAATLVLPIALLAGPAIAIAIAFGALLAGGAVTLTEVLWATVIQSQVPQEALSRVAAYDWFGSLALEPLGFVVIGALAADIGTSTTLWACAALVLACQIAVLLVPSVRRLEAKPETFGHPELLAPTTRV